MSVLHFKLHKSEHHNLRIIDVRQHAASWKMIESGGKQGKREEPFVKTLNFDEKVYDEGNGWFFRKVMSLSLPGLVLAAFEIALINTGMLSAEKVPSLILKLIGLVTVLYVLPSVFAFPTAWFLSSGRTRLYKNARIELYKKKIVYHKVLSLTMSKPRYVVYSVTQLRKVEVRRGVYILHGAVTNETAGGSESELRIPAAFENMKLISEMARYR